MMTDRDRCCTLVPYFRVADGKIEAFKQLCQQFVEQTRSEPKCLYYGFSFNGNVVHCREGYQDAAGLLFHLENVGSILEEALKISELIRLEIHAPEAELNELQKHLSHLEPQYFCLEYGFRR